MWFSTIFEVEDYEYDIGDCPRYAWCLWWHSSASSSGVFIKIKEDSIEIFSREFSRAQITNMTLVTVSGKPGAEGDIYRPLLWNKLIIKNLRYNGYIYVQSRKIVSLIRCQNVKREEHLWDQLFLVRNIMEKMPHKKIGFLGNRQKHVLPCYKYAYNYVKNVKY